MKKTDHLPTFRQKKTRKKLMRGLMLFSPAIALFCLVTAIYIVSYYEKTQQKQEESQGIVVQAGRQESQYKTEHSNVLENVPNVEKEGNVDTKNELSQENSQQDMQQGMHQIIPADDSTDIYITPRMTYTLETYDARTRQFTNETQPIPTDMYGLNRVELEQYLMDLAEQENFGASDLVHHYQVTVFSRRAFTVRLTITEKKPEYAVFLIAEDGWLTAYTGDRTAVYEELHIALGDFPLEQQAMLTQGIYMRTLADYYDFLESYSS